MLFQFPSLAPVSERVLADTEVLPCFRDLEVFVEPLHRNSSESKPTQNQQCTKPYQTHAVDLHRIEISRGERLWSELAHPATRLEHRRS